MEDRLYLVVGIDDLEGETFAECTTLNKAKKAMKLLEKEGLEDMLEIVQSEIPIDYVEIDGKLIEL